MGNSWAIDALNHDVSILVCACGKRLRAPGATPGRVGRCPACGDIMRVPEPAPIPIEPKPKPRKKKKTAAPCRETAIWDGLVKAPRTCESGIGTSLLYPFWGTTGIVLLILFPPLLWITSVPFFSP